MVNGKRGAEWKCKEGCKAECCGMQVMSNERISRNRDKARNVTAQSELWYGFTILITSDGKCAFLDRESFRCLIYEDRPQVCRDYGQVEDLPCPYVDLRGKLRTPAKVKRTQRFINHHVDRVVNLLRT